MIQTSQSTSLQRLIQKRNLSQEDALERIRAQSCRRGIGNLAEEIEMGTVTGVIPNDGGEEQLWDGMKSALVDVNYWKDGQCPGENNAFFKFLQD